MCVVVIKKKEFNVSKRNLRKCFYDNPDGAGYMYRDVAKGCVVIKKGYMSFKAFYNEYVKDTKGKDAVIHFRFATHGEVSQSNCHPFPISRDIRDLRALYFETDIGFAHNGIIRLEESHEAILHDLSDSMEYVRAIAPIRDRIFDPAIKPLIDLSTIGSKIAIMSMDDLLVTGNKWKEIKGVLYSNSYWQQNGSSSGKKFVVFRGKKEYESWLEDHYTDKTSYMYDPEENAESDRFIDYTNENYCSGECFVCGSRCISNLAECLMQCEDCGEACIVDAIL